MATTARNEKLRKEVDAVYFVDSRLLYPLSSLNAEYRIPETAQLRGLMYDYSDHSLIVYDNVETKLMWISRDDGAVRASALVYGDEVDKMTDLLSMASYQDVCYMLGYEGDGHLSLYTCSLANARDEAKVEVTRHPIAYNDYLAPNDILWNRTHEVNLKYYRFHPDYCGLFNIGPTFYIIAGVSRDVTPNTAPIDMGQYIAELELSGKFVLPKRIDMSSRLYRWSVSTKLAGTAVAGSFHDGVLDLLCREVKQQSSQLIESGNVVHSVRYNGTGGGSMTIYDSAWYDAGNLPIGSDMVTAGRYSYILADNRIYRSTIAMIKIEMEAGWPNVRTLDLGTLSSGATVYRVLHCKNVAPVSTFYDMVIESQDPMLQLSLTGGTGATYHQAVTLTGALKPNDTFDLYVKLAAPEIDDERYAPYQYMNTITLRPRAKVEYA